MAVQQSTSLAEGMLFNAHVFNLFCMGRVSNMKNELSRNFQQTIVLGLPNCQIDKRAVGFAFDSLLE